MASLGIEPSYTSRVRAERLIGAGRAVLAAFSLFAIWLDPSTPSRHPEVAHILLAIYLVYALCVVLLVWWLQKPSERLAFVTHLIDMLAFTLFMYFTDVPTSPFFGYFVFLMLVGALRWEWRGAFWTGLTVLAVFIGLGLYNGYIQHDPAFELSNFIIRIVYLAIVAILLGYMNMYQQRLRDEMSWLAA